MFDAKRFCQDYSIKYFTEGPNTRPGWVQIRCRMCHDHSNHGGFSIEDGIYNCWKCGIHNLEKVIKTLLNISWKESAEIIKDYSRNIFEEKLRDKYANKSRTNKEQKTLQFPKGTGELTALHKKYLKKRGFDPDEIEKEWGIKATHHTGSYKFRIMIPIIIDGNLVSYQARDITGKSELRYKACAIEAEIIHHKFIVYGADKIKNRKSIIVEGLLDVWKLGPGAVATFGTGFTKEQGLFIADHCDEVFVLYDNEIEAQKKAEKLCAALSDCGVICENIIQTDYEDPGEMPKDIAEKLRFDLLQY